MMDFSLTQDQQTVREALRAFLLKECPIEYVRRCDEEERFPFELDVEAKFASNWLAAKG